MQRYSYYRDNDQVREYFADRGYRLQVEASGKFQRTAGGQSHAKRQREKKQNKQFFRAVIPAQPGHELVEGVPKGHP
ncbi:MAG TPA: hypothetical protein DD458_07840, partial [Prolixibacteraceae bacterium]|nr:hypothetical protein [Prolixibacteraceae bacterium]HCU59586.1 hypothetical protein [Prolixibacteraceae bacterium]